jgi:seryl-tRNA synthetase
MPLEMTPAGEPSGREILETRLRELLQEKTRLEEQLARESADGVEPLDAEDVREEIRRVSEQIMEAENSLYVVDGTRMPDTHEGQGEIPM